MNQPEEYGICIRLTRQDGADLYEGRVKELPDLKVYCETYSEAYEEIVDAIGAAQQLFSEERRQFPAAEPIEEDFSGRVTLRMSKSLHRCVHLRASDDGVSLNQWVVEAIAWRIQNGNMVAADSVVLVTPTREQAGTSVGIMLVQTQHIGTISSPQFGTTFNVFFPSVGVDQKAVGTPQYVFPIPQSNRLTYG